MQMWEDEERESVIGQNGKQQCSGSDVFRESVGALVHCSNDDGGGDHIECGWILYFLISTGWAREINVYVYVA